MVDIPEYKRDESRDYLFALKSINEIPFPVGKKLLGDFLIGDMENKSILKNNLYDLYNYGSLDSISRFKIDEIIDSLLTKGFISQDSAMFNKNIKVLGITKLGQDEILEPTINVPSKTMNDYVETENNISNAEMESFKELDSFLGNLNIEQRKAAITPKQSVLCIAGAGSGKTSVLTKRIQFLNQLKKVPRGEILAITFTRKAKIQMESKLKELGVTTNIETFNSFCEKILLKNGGRVYGRRVRVATYQDKMMAILRALEFIGISIQDAIDVYFQDGQKKYKSSYQLQNMFMNDCFSVLEFYKATRKDLEDFSKGVSGKDYDNAKMIYNIVKFLDTHMKSVGLRTYTDQVNDVLEFFKKSPKYIPKFTHILVDEYQDVNNSQVELLSLLNPENLFCVGDPRQSIFGWRGSSVDFILNLAKEEQVEVINLYKNYRSNSHIVNLMNNAISKMGMKDLEHNYESPKEMKLCQFGSEDVEFDFIGNKVISSSTPKNEIFILARTNKQLNEISQSFKKKNIAHILKTDDNRAIMPKENEVVLATIHSIKGLEAEEVYVIGCTKKNFPCRATEHPVMGLVKMYEYDREEEERRLFYVAISRAKKKLFLTYSGSSHSYFINEKMVDELDKVKY